MRYPDQTGWVPEWARRAVFYHIYPLGFFNAPRENGGRSATVPRLAGLRNYYEHLSGLGVSALYLGPLFESGTHGYDTIDYRRVDRRLGDNALLAELVRELHERGMRVILDGVFHHTGREFFAFQDLRERQRDSAYREWYLVDWKGESDYGDGFAYQSWEGHQALPRLNLDHEPVRDYLFEVARQWLGEVGIDGWRLDVAQQISPAFWWEFRRVCKETRSDCFLVGELLGGDYRTHVAPDLLDSGTDYQLYKALWSALNHGNFWELKAVLERAMHPEWGLYRDLHLLTFLGNHDVTRIGSLLKDPRHVYVAQILLLTLPGIPCLYYGDEIGMQGRIVEDPRRDDEVRRPMPAPHDVWPDRERALYREIARLTALRREHPALIYGRYAALETGNTVFSYLRQHPRESAVVAVNAGREPESLTIPVGREGIPDGVLFHDTLDAERPAYHVSGGALTVEQVHPGWGRVLISGQ